MRSHIVEPHVPAADPASLTVAGEASRRAALESERIVEGGDLP